MRALRWTLVALALTLLTLAGIFAALPDSETTEPELIVQSRSLPADGRTGITDDERATARRSLADAQAILDEETAAEEEAVPLHPAEYGYDSLEEMNQAIREQLGVPDDLEIVIVHEVRDGRDGIGIGIGPRGT